MKNILRNLVLAAVLAGSSLAAPILTLDPASGNLTGVPGQTVGWGFRIAADPNDWITFVGSFLLFETDPGIGFYSDLIGSKGGPVNGVLAPGSPDWVEAFDFAQGLGLGMYEFAPFAPLGRVNQAQLFVFYERFSDDPSICPECYLGSGELIADVSASVGDIPEPGTLSLVALAGLSLLLRRRRQAARR